jgi:hypothetical protein
MHYAVGTNILNVSSSTYSNDYSPETLSEKCCLSVAKHIEKE